MRVVVVGVEVAEYTGQDGKPKSFASLKGFKMRGALAGDERATGFQTFDYRADPLLVKVVRDALQRAGEPLVYDLETDVVQRGREPSVAVLQADPIDRLSAFSCQQMVWAKRLEQSSSRPAGSAQPRQPAQV